MTASRIISVLLIVVGVGLLAWGFVGPGLNPAILGLSSTLIFIGVINLIMWGWMSKMFKGYKMKSMGEAMAETREKMGDMRSQLENKERVGKLRSEGVLGKASILSMTDTGEKITGDPVMRYELSVEIPLYPVYTVTHEQFTPQLMLPQIVPGKTFNVRVDKSDQQNLNIEWV